MAAKDPDSPLRALTGDTHEIDIDSLPGFHAPRVLLAWNYFEHIGLVRSDAGLINLGAHLSAAKDWEKLTDAERYPFLNPTKLVMASESVRFAQVIGLAGDFFESADELYSANKARLEGALWAAENAEQTYRFFSPELRSDRVKADAVELYWRYAFRNVDHFREADKAQKRFVSEMATALRYAKNAHESADLVHAQSLFHRALVYCGVACHFLTDCFSAGHLRTPRAAVMRACEEIYGKDEIRFSLKSAIGYDIVVTKAALIAGSYALYMHDKENKAGLNVITPLAPGGEILGMEGRDEFKTYGDGGLERSPKSANYASLAVAMAVRAVWQTRFFGSCEYVATAKTWDNPLFYVPELGRNREAPLLSASASGEISGKLWSDTAALRADKSDASMYALAAYLISHRDRIHILTGNLLIPGALKMGRVAHRTGQAVTKAVKNAVNAPKDILEFMIYEGINRIYRHVPMP